MDWGKCEKSFLLYLESVLVDNRGHVDGAKINDEDRKISEKMARERLIWFSRRPARDIMEENEKRPMSAVRRPTHYVRFTELAWELAHRFRRERAEKTSRTVTHEEIEHFEADKIGKARCGEAEEEGCTVRAVITADGQSHECN